MLAVTVGAAAPAAASGSAAPGNGGLRKFDDCRSFTDYMRTVTDPEVGPYGNGGGPMLYRNAPMADAGSAAPQAATDGTAVENSPTGTNVQEAGVDEPDVAKVDGSFLYTLTGGRLAVVDTAGTAPRLRGTLSFQDGNPNELLVLPQHRLLVIGNHWTAYPQPGPVRPMPGPLRPAPGPIRPQSGGVVAQPMIVRPIRPGGTSLDLTVVDVSDADHPTVEWVETITGSYLSARLHDGVARIVLGSTPHVVYRPMENGETPEAATARNRAALDAAPAGDFLPTREVRDGAGHVRASGPLLRCTDVSRPQDPSGSGVISILTVDTRQGTAHFTDAHGTGVIGNGDLVYSSADRLYVATTQGGWNPPRPMPMAGSQSAAPAERRTAIHAFDATGRTSTPYLGSGSVAGFLLGRWAFSEHDGYLRVATTTGQPWSPPGEGPSGPGTSQSSVIVLAEKPDGLRQVGSVTGLGAGERIYGIRWFDDLAAVVTFRQMDPLYLVDLSDPRSPTLRGQLELTGYSAYLHPTGSSRLMGIGQDADAQGHPTGLQAQEFDVSAPEHPQRTGKVELGQGSTQLENDSRAFAYLTDRHLAVFPAYVTEKVKCPPNAQCYTGGGPGFVGQISVPAALAISVDSRGGLHQAGKFIADSMIVRVLPVAGRLVAISGTSVYLLNPDGLTEMGSTRIVPNSAGPTR
ncbi:MAG TPA: beta-propeller domain-containing protein [Sporichthyaceae bacterium]|jgi:uncharacterized secreted protein with C-terminal beta-propeller domain|nr:beta-propeller domain-containing protein [Sporichthyaceae bacterium]